VIFVLRENLISAWRSRKPFFAGGDSRFADELFPFEEISALIGNVDHDFRRARNSVAIPISWWRSRRDRCAGGGRWDFGAPDHKREGAQGKEGSKQRRNGHSDAQSNASRSRFNTKDLEGECAIFGQPREKVGGTVRLYLPSGPVPDSLTAKEKHCPCIAA
jgi:hypothetical protein